MNLPVAFWKNGWIVRLSGRAIALLLILKDVVGGRDPQQGVYVRPDNARLQYGLSEDTWSRGVKELKEAGLIVVTREKHGDLWDFVRIRNKYKVVDSPFETPAM